MFCTVSLETTQEDTSVLEGTSNITSSIMLSMMALRPRAPVFRLIASLAIASSASASNSSETLSISSIFWYCFTSAFLGSERIRTSAASSSGSSVEITGKRPTNSGIKPNLNRSSGRTMDRYSPGFKSTFMPSVLKPITFFLILRLIICSKPSKAPPQIKRIFVVSI
ncbi:hypothetical protein D3C85_1444050 [compost metagenome]